MRRLIFAALCTPTMAMAASLNEPVVDKPTIGSEIRRGYESAALCEEFRRSEALDRCFKRVEAEDAAKRTTYAPFRIGLRLGSLLRQDGFYRALDETADRTLDAKAERAAANLHALQDASDVKIYSRELGISLDQVLDAARHDSPTVRDRIKFWTRD